jgi:quercetin dioxygenase-like cupin family protein
MPIRANRAGSTRRTETQNAVMTTFASPTQGDASVLSMWQVDMRQGQRDPDHTVDSEQIWHVTSGELAIAIEQETMRLAAGDTLVVPEALPRQVVALTDATAVVCGFGDAIVAMPGEAGFTPAWIG